MKFRTLLLGTLAVVVSGLLVAQAQVPGVNSTLNSVFTLAYDNSTMKQTFSTSSSFTTATGATDLCTLTGSATKTLKVRRVLVGGRDTAVITEIVNIVKRSTANSGGTAITPTVVPYDSANAAGTGVARAYTANPTLGTTVGILTETWLTFANATTGVGVPLTVVFGQLGQPIVLRGTTQVLAVNMQAVSGAAVTFTCTFEWTEE